MEEVEKNIIKFKTSLNPGQMASKITNITDECISFNIAAPIGNEARINTSLIRYICIIFSISPGQVSLDLDADDNIIVQISDKSLKEVIVTVSNELKKTLSQ